MSEPEDWEDMYYSSSGEDIDEITDRIIEESKVDTVDELLQKGKPVYEKAKKKLDKIVKKIDKMKDLTDTQKDIIKLEAARKIYSTIPNPKDLKRVKRDRSKVYKRMGPNMKINLSKYTGNPGDIDYEWDGDVRKFPDYELSRAGREDIDKTQMDKIQHRVNLAEKSDSRIMGEYDLYDRNIAERVGQTLGESGYNAGLTHDVRPEDEETSRNLRSFVGDNLPPRDYSRMGSFTRRTGRLGTMYLNPSSGSRSPSPIQVEDLAGYSRDYIQKKKERRSRTDLQRPIGEVSQDMGRLHVSPRRQSLQLKRRRNVDYKKPSSQKTGFEIQRDRDAIAAKIANRSMILKRNIEISRRKREEQKLIEIKEKREEQNRLQAEYRRIISKRERPNMNPEQEARERMENRERKRKKLEARREYYEQKAITSNLQDLSLTSPGQVDETAQAFFQASSGPITELQREMSLIELEDEENGIARSEEGVRQEAIRRINNPVRGTRSRGRRGTRGTRGTRGRK
jgi:hypothetical protein